MAPVTATALGMEPQTIDDPKLKEFMAKLNSYSFDPNDVEGFVEVLANSTCWRFQEQADLYEWIPTLNAIDAALSHFLSKYPSLLLVAPVPRKNAKPEETHAKSIKDVQSVPQEVPQALVTVLQFLSTLLKHATNKLVFNSIDEVVDLLGAADDAVSSLATQVLCHLATPPLLHKQQAPEMHQHSTLLHNSSQKTAHGRLVASARGWGTRGSGLGLHACVTADDSEYNTLPKEAAQVVFDFFADGKEQVVRLSREDVADKSTAACFFACLKQASVPSELHFRLLVDVRLAKAFLSNATRVAAVENRLRALIAILYTLPSQEIMSGYFQAQPELCVELIDLLRPTVSSSAVSAAAARPGLQSISALANSPQVPYTVRTLAVESLTALVARRDGASGGLTGVARQSNVLLELGVGKGLYLGLLPTLIRYSLASLTSFLSSTNGKDESSTTTTADVGMNLGLAFVQATKPTPLPPAEQLRRALEFIDSVLTLTSSVVSAPSGTAALTDCGLIPALLSTVAIDCSSLDDQLSPEEDLHARSLLRFITSQAIQIMEGAIVTHNNALSAFHDLQGVDILASRLASEIDEIRSNGNDGDVVMENTKERAIQSSQRVLLFSIVNCLTVVFHQESAATSATSPLGGAQLRKPELTSAVKEIMEHVDTYGGVLAALTSSLLSDVMNSDPQVVHHIHGSGLAKAFLDMIMGVKEGRPTLPPVPELIMAIPNVLSALSLTEDGATAVIEVNPFPALLSIFYNPEYAMPKTRCLLNEMTAIVGTGLDEIMRHVPRHSQLVMKAIVEAMLNVVKIGSKLSEREEHSESASEATKASLELERTCLMQYAMNFGQMLEQILHNDDHCEPFVKAGGLDAILTLFPHLMPAGSQFLAHVSCLSCPSVCTLTHSTTEDSLTIAFKCVALHYDPHFLLVRMKRALEAHLDSLEATTRDLRDSSDEGDGSEHALTAEGILEAFPRKPLHEVPTTEASASKAGRMSKYLRDVITLQWLSNLTAGVIRAASQRGQETGTGWSRNEREWKKLLSSPSFWELLGRLSTFYQSSILEACRIRTEDGFEDRDRSRLTDQDGKHVRFRLRIVCQEGAVVRDGIDIDSCANVGSMEMGEIEEAFERCVNSSGVMRYRTRRGWVSELTRGHGREPIAEVLKVWVGKDAGPPASKTSSSTAKGKSCGIADLCSVGASILARLQNSYGEVFSSLSRVSVQSFKALPVRTMSYEPDTVGAHVKSLLQMLATNITKGFTNELVSKSVTGCSESGKTTGLPSKYTVNNDGVAMYLGSLLSHIQACLFEEKRERRMVNVPLLICLLNVDEDWFREPKDADGEDAQTPIFPQGRGVGFLQALRFVFRQSLSDLRDSATTSIEKRQSKQGDKPFQCVSRSVAASLPPSIGLVKRLISASIGSSSLAAVMKRLGDNNKVLLLDNTVTPSPRLYGWIGKDLSFNPDYFAKALLCTMADTVFEVWEDPRFIFMPAHIVHPIATLSEELISSLGEASKPSSLSRSASREGGPWDFFSPSGLSRLSRRQENDEDDGDDDEEFEASEEAVSHLMDMGFSRELALDALESTRSNRLEVAMEYALSQGHVNIARLELRRNEREERRRRSRDNQDNAESGGGANNGDGDAQGETSQDGAVRDEEMAESEANTERREENGAKEKKSVDAEASEDVSYEKLMAKRVEDCRQAWIKSAPSVAVEIIAGSEGDGVANESKGDRVAMREDDGKGLGNAEAEALTVVLCSFLLDVCQRYPEERTRVVSHLLEKLKSQFSQIENGGGSYRISPEHACSFASLCHAAVLCTRALPKTRTLVLEKDLVHRLVSSIQLFMQGRVQPGDSDKGECAWPIWLAPSLLLLDVMSQPMAAFADGAPSSKDEDRLSDGGELSKVREEHRQQAAAMAKTANDLFSSLRALEQESRDKSKGTASNAAPVSSGSKLDTSDDARSGSNAAELKSEKTEDARAEASAGTGPFASVPPYFPLLPLETSEACVSLCLDLIKSGSSEKAPTCSAPAGILQAGLFLLTRLLRSPKMASQCLRSGAAESILSLPKSCRFNGNAGVVTTIFRRLLEDDATLQAAMETEIRSAITKLHGKQRRPRHGAVQDEKVRVLRRSFVQVVMPLICRDPATFLKAAATSICIELDKSEGSSQSEMVVLLSPEQRARNARALADVLKSQDSQSPEASDAGQGKKGTKTSSSSKSHHRHKSSHRATVSKQKKSKKERNDGATKSNTQLNGTPANHVTCLLIARAISLSTLQSDKVSSDAADSKESAELYGESGSFLWLADLLEIMSDLVLAVPSCAAAIHRYRPQHSKERSSRGHSAMHIAHALNACPNPPRTFVNFLLHSVLPQDRWNSKNSQALDVSNDEDESSKQQKKAAHMKTRVAQTAARLLVSLIARAGEGRRRVIADLAFALSGGRLGHVTSLSPPSASDRISGEYEFYALQSWGELCIGLAAPRSNGVNLENTSTISFEVVKLMLDFGMAHALMYALKRVKLEHPMAAGTCASLLVPVEVFTRGTVSNSVQAIADKQATIDKRSKLSDSADDGKALKAKKTGGATRSVSVGPSQRSETSFADDAMLEDGFDAESAARHSRGRDHPYEEGSSEDNEDNAAADYDMMDDAENGGSTSDDEEMEDADVDGSENESESADEEISSDESGAASEAETADDEDGSSSDSQEGEMDEDFEDEIEDNENAEWSQEDANDPLVEGDLDGDEINVAAGALGPGESDFDEGWTRIEANGFGGMLMGNRRTFRAAGPSGSARSRGFIDTAEALIGSLLRTGDIQGDTLAELEGTLGIRIVPHNRAPPELVGRRDTENGLRSAPREGERSSSRNSLGSDAVGTMPLVHQRGPPDTGYTAIGGGGRWNEISSMEYVYGGPSVAAGSRNYDLSFSISPEEERVESYATLTQAESQLFPGGPASATHSRTQQSLHPLLCGVDLPPVNSLVSDLQPHGVRASRQSQRRRSENWPASPFSSGGYLVSTSTGNVVRLNRGATGGPFPDFTRGANASQTAASSLLGWTDDGLPFDGTVGDFSSAFERALGESMQAMSRAPAPAAPEDEPDTSSDQPHDAVAASSGASEPTGAGEDPSGSSGAADVRMSDASSEVAAAAGDTQEGEPGIDPASSSAAANADVASGAPNDGDGVASSLAAGLRLSPGSEASGSSDQVMSAENQADETQAQNASAASEEVAAVEGVDDVSPAEGQAEQEGEVEARNNDTAETAAAAAESQEAAGIDESALVCPPGMDEEVFNCLPIEMRREVIEQARSEAEVAGQLDSSSGLDPEALAALPADMRQEVIAQEQRERRLREQAPADPSNAEEMDNASFIASLAPDLRQEILLQADDAFLNSLPPNIIAEAQILRERASVYHRRGGDDALAAGNNRGGRPRPNDLAARAGAGDGGIGGSSRRKLRTGKMKMDCDRQQIVYLPSEGPRKLSPLIGYSDLKALVRLMYMRSPVRPQRLLQRVFQNVCTNVVLRNIVLTSLTQLLNDCGVGAVAALQTVAKEYADDDDWRKKNDAEFSDQQDGFPPAFLIGAAPELHDAEDPTTHMLFRRRQGNSQAASIAANLPTSARGSNEESLPPVVATLIADTLFQLSKGSPRVCTDALTNEMVGADTVDANGSTVFDKLIDLLEKPRYAKSSTNLEQLLNLIEIMVTPLSGLPKDGEEEHEVSQREMDAAASAGKEFVDIPRIVVSQPRLQILCSILRMESCRDVAFTKVNAIARRLCRVEANRGYILGELGAVAQSLATDAVRDLRTLNIRMQDVASQNQLEAKNSDGAAESESSGPKRALGGSASSSVTLSISSSELKLLRVLQTLQSLCIDTSHEEGGGKKNEGTIIVTDQLVDIFQMMKLDDLWKELSLCLHAIKVLEGVKTVEEIEEKNAGNDNDGDDASEDNGSGGKQLQNSVAGLLTRFLPIIEAFFVVNASARSSPTTKEKPDGDSSSAVQAEAKDGSQEASPTKNGQKETASVEETEFDSLVWGKRLIEFVTENRVLLNALIRNNAGLLEKGLRAMVQVPRCRALLSFDVKRHWFKTQVRRLRQHASRRHGSLRLGIRRKFVFEDAYHQLRLRNAEEMRGRLHITFRDEEGIDAGGLSREFFGILAKEIFNPNYALFTSTEDGCTFQPNPNSYVNPDHLSFFRFVGRIVGKAVADGFLLDAHFTRSLYKHMLGMKPTHHDMEAIDPDYYKNLQMILEHKLDDIGLDLTFSIEDHSFGRSQTIDLIPDGRKIPVTEETKEKYVSLVCQHRMTTAISSQIKAYLDGFYELVSRDLIAIFTPRELELLISGLPDIDVHDLKANTDYHGYKSTDKEIQWFWNIMVSLSRSEKAAFLQFVTGSSKVPLAGFSELQGMRGIQKFTIHKAGGSSGSLMSAHTCFNSLDLPVYKSEEEMREKLLYSISEGGGAFLFA